MSQPSYVVVSFGGYEDLCLMFQASEGFAVDYTITIPLELSPDWRRSIWELASITMV